MKPTVVFFGSFLQYSAQVLQTLLETEAVDVIGVVTTPPAPAGRKQILTKTHVHELAESFHIPVFTPEKLGTNVLDIFKHQTLNIKHSLDFFVVAGYGKLLPKAWLAYPTIAPINIHFSLLPKYRGAMPSEWALLSGEKQTGVTLIEMSPELDTGNIYAQASIPIGPNDTRETLYEKLYPLGAELFIQTLPEYLRWKDTSTGKDPAISGVPDMRDDGGSGVPDMRAIASEAHARRDDKQITNNQEPRTENRQLTAVRLPPQPQPDQSPTPYARKLDKNDSFIPWEQLKLALDGKQPAIKNRPELLQLTADHWQLITERAIRALAGWPGVWTIVPTTKGEKRMKLLSAHLEKDQLVLDQVQLEGATPTRFNQISIILS